MSGSAGFCTTDRPGSLLRGNGAPYIMGAAMWKRLLTLCVILPTTGCSTATLRLPAPLPTPYDVRVVAGDAAGGTLLLEDRTLGRTGLSCRDCHAAAEPAIRPGPPLAARPPTDFWQGATDAVAVAVNLCVERYLARPPLDGRQTGQVVAAIVALAPQPPAAPPADPGALYDAACRHCHEGGPGPPVLGRPQSPRALIDHVRARRRPPHPGTLMPPFPPERLADADLEGLARWLADPPRGHSASAPADRVIRSAARPNRRSERRED